MRNFRQPFFFFFCFFVLLTVSPENTAFVRRTGNSVHKTAARSALSLLVRTLIENSRPGKYGFNSFSRRKQ